MWQDTGRYCHGLSGGKNGKMKLFKSAHGANLTTHQQPTFKGNKLDPVCCSFKKTDTSLDTKTHFERDTSTSGQWNIQPSKVGAAFSFGISQSIPPAAFSVPINFIDFEVFL